MPYPYQVGHPHYDGAAHKEALEEDERRRICREEAVCACVRDDALDCAQARYGATDEPCECCCHEADPDDPDEQEG